MKNYFFFIAFFLMVSCEVVVDVDIPLKPASITVHSTINPDSVFQVQLTASQNILSNNEFALIPGATVSIFENEVLLERLSDENDGVYSGLLKPVKGREYKIEVSKENYKTVEASDVVPNTDVQLATITFSEDARDQYSQHQYKMTVEFDDPKGENFYEIGLYGPEYRYEWDDDTREPYIIDTLFVPYYIDSDDVIFVDNQYYSDTFWAFSDEVVDGKHVKISFTTYINQFWDEQIDELELTVVLREISYPLYKYKQTANLQRSLDGDPFAEPVPVYNNIKNGFGVFGAFQQTAKKVVVHK